MNIETEMRGNEGGNLPYEQPRLKNYGTMKELTLDSGGSGADGPGRVEDIKRVTCFGNVNIESGSHDPSGSDSCTDQFRLGDYNGVAE